MAKHPSLPLVAGIASALSGAVLLTCALQLGLFVRWIRPPFHVAPWFMLVFGAVALISGAALIQARWWAVLVAAASNVLGALLMFVWLVFAVLGGYLSLLNLAAPFVCTAAAVLSLLALPTVRQADEERKSLYAD